MLLTSYLVTFVIYGIIITLVIKYKKKITVVRIFNIMGFWKKVDEYLNYKEITRKELAFAIGINTQTLDRAIQRDSEPKLVEGIKTCIFLNTFVNDFLDNPIQFPNEKYADEQQELKNQLSLYRKYNKLIEYCEKLSDERRAALTDFTKALADAEET